MAQEVRITGYHGINNLLSRDRIKNIPTREDPLVDLSAAQNFLLDDTGKPTVRGGYTVFQAMTKPHSGFAAAGVAVYVLNGTLYRFYPVDKTSVPLVIVGEAPMRYWAHADRIWFTNKAVIGEIKDGAATLFAQPANATEFKEMLPPGQAIAFFRGRLYTAFDEILSMSDDTHLARMESETSYVQFTRYIRLIAPTLDGLYVGTDKAVYFGKGGTLNSMAFVRVSNSPAKHVAPLYLDAENVKDVNVEGTFPLFETMDGVCYGLPGGQIENLTDDRYVMPAGTSGASFLHEVNGQVHYISAVR